MGALKTEELHISPVVSLVMLVLMVILLDIGSRFFRRMMRVPERHCAVLDVFKGQLVDIKARQMQLSSHPTLAGLRSLLVGAAGSNRSLQREAASSLSALTVLAEANSDSLEASDVEALVELTAKYTTSSRGHAALGLVVSAFSPSARDILLEGSALGHLIKLATMGDGESEGASALGIAMLAQSEGARSRMLEANVLPAILTLLSSKNVDAVRCAAFALSSLGEFPASHGPIISALPPKVVVMLCRSQDTILQACGARLISSIASDPDLRLRFLHAQCVPPLCTIASSSFSAVAKCEAMHTLRVVSERSDEAMSRQVTYCCSHLYTQELQVELQLYCASYPTLPYLRILPRPCQEREQDAWALMYALADFSSSLIQPPRLKVCLVCPH